MFIYQVVVFGAASEKLITIAVFADHVNHSTNDFGECLGRHFPGRNHSYAIPEIIEFAGEVVFPEGAEKSKLLSVFNIITGKFDPVAVPA